MLNNNIYPQRLQSFPVRSAGRTEHRAGSPDHRVLTAARETENRDRQLWTITLFTLSGIGVGFAALSVATGALGAAHGSLPQLVFGFATLVTCLNIYLGKERRMLGETRAALLEQFIRGEEALAQSFIDPLTGLFNRRYVDYLAVREAKRADRSAEVFSVAIIDVDGFKAINDRFGHAAGDGFLKQVADILRSTFRQTDTVARYGGDEFLILMPGTREASSRPALERLSRAVDGWNRDDPSRRFRLSLSWGVACYEPNGSLDEVIALADRRMYGRKNEKASSILADLRPARARLSCE